jgi:hypothetical protein
MKTFLKEEVVVNMQVGRLETKKGRMAGAFFLVVLLVFLTGGFQGVGVSVGTFPNKVSEIQVDTVKIAGIPQDRQPRIEMLEDSGGILHAVYLDEKGSLCHRSLGSNGKWSNADTISESKNLTGQYISDFHLMLSPEGKLCAIWMQDPSDFHMSRLANGKWSETREEVLEQYKAENKTGADPFESLLARFDETATHVSEFKAFFDKQGKLHLFCYQKVKGWFYDGSQITKEYNKDDVMLEDSMVKGIGNALTGFDVFVDPKGIIHLFCCSYDRMADSRAGKITISKYLHSISKDNGKTWEGPYVLAKELHKPFLGGVIADAEGNLQLLISNQGESNSMPNVFLGRITVQNKVTFDTYFNFMELLKKKASLNVLLPSLSAMSIDKAGNKHFYGADTHVILKKDGVWHLQRIPVSVGIDKMLMRKNEKVVYYGIDYGKQCYNFYTERVK